MIHQAKSAVDLAILRYEVTTALYMLEPWEKWLINLIFISSTLLFLSAVVNYLPGYVVSIMDAVAKYT